VQLRAFKIRINKKKKERKEGRKTPSVSWVKWGRNGFPRFHCQLRGLEKVLFSFFLPRVGLMRRNEKRGRI